MNFLEILKRYEENLSKYDRFLPLEDIVCDRWELAESFGFGPGTSIYPSARLFGLSKLKVGSNVWIGPNVLLDATGDLSIGDWCSISSGVEIYTHESVGRALSGGEKEITRRDVKIGNRCHVGPGAKIFMGVHVPDGSIIGANACVYPRAFGEHEIMTRYVDNEDNSYKIPPCTRAHMPRSNL